MLFLSIDYTGIVVVVVVVVTGVAYSLPTRAQTMLFSPLDKK
jgi:hypothetical protein